MPSQIISTLDEQLIIPNSQPTIALRDGTTIQGPECACEGKMTVPDGATVTVASQPNTRPHDGYQGKNSDAAVVIALPPVTVSPAETLSNALLKAGEALKNNIGTEQGGGSTGTAVWYDPKTYTLDVSSIGDTPAFIVFHDGNKGISLQINDRNDEMLARMGMGTSSLDNFREPPISANCTLLDEFRGSFTGQLKLDRLKQVVQEHYGLDPNLMQATLVLASDCIDPLAKVDSPHEDSTVFRGELPNLVHKAMQSCADIEGHNAASIVARAAAEKYASKKARKDPAKKYHDDSTVVIMPLLKDLGGPEGGPVVLFMADGMKEKGQHSSHDAVKDFTDTMLSLGQSRSATVDSSAAIPEGGSTTWVNPSLKRKTTESPIDPSGVNDRPDNGASRSAK